MGSRKETPDILGELLGGNTKLASAESGGSQTPLFDQEDHLPEGISKPKTALPEISPQAKPDQADIKLGENLLTSAENKLKTAEKFLGRDRILDWLSEIQYNLGKEEIGEPSAEASLENRVIEWAEKHLRSIGSRMNYRAHGLKTSKPYRVDVWTHLKGERYRPDLDVWIDCRYENEPVTKRDILKIVTEATDIYHAAHTDKQEFWFDRLMFVSLAPFDKEVLELADEHGVVCVFYDRTSFIIQTDPYWKLKPRWLKDAEENQKQC